MHIKITTTSKWVINTDRKIWRFRVELPKRSCWAFLRGRWSIVGPATSASGHGGRRSDGRTWPTWTPRRVVLKVSPQIRVVLTEKKTCFGVRVFMYRDCRVLLTLQFFPNPLSPIYARLCVWRVKDEGACLMCHPGQRVKVSFAGEPIFCRWTWVVLYRVPNIALLEKSPGPM